MLVVMIGRTFILSELKNALARSRVVVLTGPRQCGKTTLTRELLEEDSVNYFDLGGPANLARLDEPMTALRPLNGLVVIDEIQRRPDLFPVLRVLADRGGAPARFLILGSASGNLMRQTSESLAGRMERIVIGGFSLAEAGFEAEQHLWLRGGLPPVLLAASNVNSTTWRKNFIKHFLNVTFPSGVYELQQPPFNVFGPWWRITTGRFGIRPNLPALLALVNQPHGAIWICSRTLL